jgi:hypothetical protein
MQAPPVDGDAGGVFGLRGTLVPQRALDPAGTRLAYANPMPVYGGTHLAYGQGVNLSRKMYYRKS